MTPKRVPPPPGKSSSQPCFGLSRPRRGRGSWLKRRGPSCSRPPGRAGTSRRRGAGGWPMIACGCSAPWADLLPVVGQDRLLHAAPVCVEVPREVLEAAAELGAGNGDVAPFKPSKPEAEVRMRLVVSEGRPALLPARSTPFMAHFRRRRRARPPKVSWPGRWRRGDVPAWGRRGWGRGVSSWL